MSPSASTPDSPFDKELRGTLRVPDIFMNDREELVASLEDAGKGGEMVQVCSEFRVVEFDQLL